MLDTYDCGRLSLMCITCSLQCSQPAPITAAAAAAAAATTTTAKTRARVHPVFT